MEEDKVKKAPSRPYWQLLGLSVFAAFLFSTSGVMVAGLKLAFQPSAQLLVRAVVAVVASYVWLKLFDKSYVSPNAFVKYKKPDIYIALILRTAGYVCFIWAIGQSGQYATLALMLLLTSKMLANVIQNIFTTGKFPGMWEIVGYSVVVISIIIFGVGSEFRFAWIALLAVLSGIFEAWRLDLVKSLKIDDKDAAQFNFWEFVGTLVIALAICLFVLLLGKPLLTSGWEAVLTVKTAIAVLLAVAAFGIAKLDIYLTSKIPTGTYSAILATEIGFAGWLNNKFLPNDHEFGPFQKIGLILSIISISLIGISSAKRKKEAEMEAEKLRKQILMEG